MRWSLLFLLVLTCSLVSAASHSVYPSFSAAEPGFVVNNQSLSVVDDAVYKTGWYSIAGADWQSFSLSGSPYGASTDWLSGASVASLPDFGVGEHYVIIYSCSNPNNWDCHGNSAYPDGFWQLMVINISTDGGSVENYLRTFYVSNSLGNDSWSGKAPTWNGTDGPWKTITKVNSETFQPGDGILFKRGDTWIVTQPSNVLLIDSYSGNATHQITYGAYGSGDKPIITGRQSINGWDDLNNWEDMGNNIWSMDASDSLSDIYYIVKRGRLWFDGVEVKKAESTTIPTSLLPWTHNRYTIYVYAQSNPANYYSNIESTGLTNSDVSVYEEYITIQNIDFRGVGNQPVYLDGANNFVIENSAIGWDSGNNGITAYRSNNVRINGNTFDTNDHSEDNYSRSNTENGLSIADGCNDFDIYNNTFVDWHHSSFSIYNKIAGNPITNIKFHDNFCTGPDVDYGRAFLYNIAGSIGVGKAIGNEIYNNYFYDQEVNSQISGDGLKVYNNVFDTVRGCSYRSDIVASGLAIHGYYGNANNNEIYNNIFMNAKDYGLEFAFTSSFPSNNNSVRNNIFYNNDEDEGVQIFMYHSPNNGPTTFQNNLVYTNSSFTDLIYYGHLVTEGLVQFGDQCYINLSAFNGYDGLGGDVISDNILGNPTLNTDYTLQQGSPAIDAGVIIPGFHCATKGAHPNEDCVEWYGNAPDIGAFEYQSGPKTYYVSNSLGNDSWSGKAPTWNGIDGPWKTISKVNSETFQPGDEILFKRGNTWRETLTVLSSGNSTDYITFGAYSSGDKPRILGSEQANEWTEVSANVWRSNTIVEDIYSANPRAEVFFEHGFGNASWGHHVGSTLDLVKEYDWTWANNNVYVYSPSNPGTRYNSVEVPQRNNVIYLNNAEYIAIDGLALFYSKSGGVMHRYRGHYGTTFEQQSLDLHGYILRNSEIAYLARKDDYGYGSYVVYSDSLVENNVIHDVGRRSICFYNYGLADIYNITIQNNTLYNGFHTTGIDLAVGSEGYPTGDMYDIYIRNNLMYEDEYKNPQQIDYGDGDVGAQLIFVNAFPDRANITGLYIYNNVFKHPTSASLLFRKIGESYVFNNVFYGQNRFRTGNNMHIFYDAGTKNIHIKNNIFYGDAKYDAVLPRTSMTLFYFSCGVGCEGMGFDEADVNNNLYYHEDDRLRLMKISDGPVWNPDLVFCMKLNPNCPYGNFTDIQEKGWEIDSPNPADPLFVNPDNNNFTLQSASPAIDAGVLIPGFHCATKGAHPNEDCVEWYGSAPDIGAFESDYAKVPVENCSDNIQNQDETGVDCGGNICAACSVPVHQNYLRTFYVSNSGNDANNDTDEQHPWKTIAKVNSESFQPGDAILFKRGDVWHENLNIERSGNSTSPIVFSAYGTGEKPVITGFATLSDWISIGNGVYEASCPNCVDNLNMVTIDNMNTPMGRWPNADTPNSGYLTIDSHVGASSITDNELSGTPDWTGAEVVIRKTHWIIDRNLITGHSGNTITYTSTSSYPAADGYGYFIQDDPKTLDDFGEWYFDSTTKNLQVYFGTENPSNHVVKASTSSTLISIDERNHIVFQDLGLTGANERAFFVRNSKYITINDSFVDFSGKDGIFGPWWGESNDFTLENTIFNHTNNNGMWLSGDFSYATIMNNTFDNTGLFPGMGGDGDEKYNALEAGGPQSIIEHNKVNNVGYMGINFGGDNTLVKNNFVTNFCLVKDDGAGIYTYRGSSSDPVYTGRKVMNNIILNGPGAPNGTNYGYGEASGIYMDGLTTGVDIINNTVAYCDYGGIFINSDANGNIINNLLYDNGNQVVLNVYGTYAPGNSPHRFLSFYNNIFFATIPSQLSFSYENSVDIDIDSTLSSDNNFYLRPLDDNYVISATQSTGNKGYTLAGWQQRYGLDLNSKKSPMTILPYTVNNVVGSNKYDNGDFDTTINGVACWNNIGNCVLSWSNIKLDGGALKVSFNAQVPATNSLLSYPIGVVSSDKNYILKFSFIADTNNKANFRVYLRKGGSPYTILTPKYFVSINTSRSENEVLFSSPISEADSVVVFEISKDDSTNNNMWIDNVELYEVDVTKTNPNDYFFFDYNPTFKDKQIALDGSYIDVNGNSVFGTITLKPYKSIILIKN